MMRNVRWQLFALLLVFTIFAGSSRVCATDQWQDAREVQIPTEMKSEQDLIASLYSLIEKEYSKYYVVNYCGCDIHSLKAGEDLTLDIKISKRLKYKSAEEMPYIVGMREKLSELKGSQNYEEALAFYQSECKRLNELYIGKEQFESIPLKVKLKPEQSEENQAISLNERGREIQSVSLLNLDRPVEINKLSLPSEEEVKQKGYLNVPSKEDGFSLLMAKASYSNRAREYNRIGARNYARKYALHYNPNYRNLNSSGGDCANFVSQCLYEGGGLSLDSYWRPYNGEWALAKALPRHMAGNGLFWKTTEANKAMAGTIIAWRAGSHVAIVDQNDTVTMTFCAHNTDRLSTSFRNLSGLDFYVPVWDSYANRYTN